MTEENPHLVFRSSVEMTGDDIIVEPGLHPDKIAEIYNRIRNTVFDVDILW